MSKSAYYAKATAAFLRALSMAPNTAECIPRPPSDVHPNTVGQVVKALADAGRIVPVGIAQSGRKARRKGLIRVWGLA